MATILLIEDNLANLENTCEILELAGYNMLTASNGKDGLAIAREHIPDLILSDIMLPQLTGYEVITELKKESRTSQIPFIFLTASVERSAIQTGLDLGAKAYIFKPFEEEELFETIRKCIDEVQMT